MCSIERTIQIDGILAYLCLLYTSGLVVMDAAEAHGAAVADILIDTVDTEDGFKLAVRAECGVQDVYKRQCKE